MNKIQVLNAFWNGFGLKAYDESSVPSDAQLPYITYEVISGSFGDVITESASLWYRSPSWQEITLKEMQIADYITRGGRMVNYDNGSMWIQKGRPWAQRMGDESEDMIRRIVLNIEIEFID